MILSPPLAPLTDNTTWRWIFVLALPLAVGALVCSNSGRAFLQSSGMLPVRQPGRDLAGTALVTVGVFLLAIGVVQGSSWGWTSAPTLLLLVSGVASLAVLPSVEGRAAHPLLPDEVRRHPRLWAADTVALISALIEIGFLLYLPLHLQNAVGYSATKYGLCLLPFTVAATVTSGFAGRLVDRVGARLVVSGGLVALGVAMALLATIGASSPYSEIFGPLVLAGIGVGVNLAPLSAAVLAAVRRRDAGVAVGLLSTGRQLGGVIGVAVLGAVLISWSTRSLTSSLAASGVSISSAQRSAFGAAVTQPSASAAILHKAGVPAETAMRLAHSAFLSGFDVVLWTASAVAICGAVLGVIALRDAMRCSVTTEVDDSAEGDGPKYFVAQHPDQLGIRGSRPFRSSVGRQRYFG